MSCLKRLTAGIALVGFLALASPASTVAPVSQRPPTRCAPDSPERRGEEGCTILASRLLVGSTAAPIYWHIERYDLLSAAVKAAGPDSVAAEAHGTAWLLTVEGRTVRRHGGSDVAWIGPLALPAADRYTMRVLSTLLMPGGSTPVHTHSGPEIFYVVSGEQCVETVSEARRLAPGSSHVVPVDTIHRGRVVGSGPRRALALVLHDAARPMSHDLAAPPQLASCE